MGSSFQASVIHRIWRKRLFRASFSRIFHIRPAWRPASDLREAFPDMKGFSGSNLKYMRFFAQHCPDGLIGQQPADQLPWFHVVTLLTKVSVEAEREWYATLAIAQGWSRGTLG